MSEEKHDFQAEVSKLLDIVAHSLYSEKEVFLRELISNASDACDRLRYLAITQPELISDDPEFRIRISLDAKKRSLAVADNGIGMSHDELIENLGTIARSGTTAFLETVQAGDNGKDAGGVDLIGQFGVGFYSAFMAADEVEVTTRKAGEDKVWIWRSDGKGAFTVTSGAADALDGARGTRIVLHLKKEDKDFTEKTRVEAVVRRYSDHIPIPILLDAGAKEDEEAVKVNEASALWTRSKSDIEEQQYTEFYRHVAHAFDEPWLTLHTKAEGKIEYNALLFVPTNKPFDLFDPERHGRVKLYVKRVFITEDCDDLLPAWLRFLRGVVDTPDLPLNISREMLQHNPVLTRIGKGLTKRVLGELKKKAEKQPDDYVAFWETFGGVVKEGLYESPDHRDALLALARFRSTSTEGWVGLADYVGRMKPGQKHIYYISGADAESLARSPQIEGYRAKGVEVLYMTDPVDEFWIPAVDAFEGKSFRSATRGGADLDGIEGEDRGTDGKPDEDAKADLKGLIPLIKLALKDNVKDVRASDRLTDSPVCLVADEGDMDMHLERMLKQHRQVETSSLRILEINPKHRLIRCLADLVGKEKAAGTIDEAARLLLDQARIVEGEPLADPADFARRMSAMIEKGVSA